MIAFISTNNTAQSGYSSQQQWCKYQYMTQQQKVIITKVTTPIATCYCATSGHLVLLHLLHGRDVLPCTSQDAATEPKHRIAWGFEHTLPPEWKCSSHANFLPMLSFRICQMFKLQTGCSWTSSSLDTPDPNKELPPLATAVLVCSRTFYRHIAENSSYLNLGDFWAMKS